MANKKYSKELKLKAITRYLNGESATKLCRELDINTQKRIYVWVQQYKSGNTAFEETRSRAKYPGKGRPKKIKDKCEMSKDEYIEYLEMKLTIAKLIAEMEE